MRKSGVYRWKAAFVVSLLGILVFSATIAGVPQTAYAAPYQDPELSVEERVTDLLSRMTLDEKIGQMVLTDRSTVSDADVRDYYLGAVLSGGGSSPSPNNPQTWADMFDQYQEAAMSTRLQIPILYGVDAVHGHNNVYGATIFPHNIGLGATRDTELVERIGEITAKEVRTTGVNWNFAPVLAAPQDERWGRTYEGFGEDPQLVSRMGTAYLKGLQGLPESDDFMKGTRVVGTLKHWVSDGNTEGGVDQGDVRLTEEELQPFIEPYADAIEAGARAVMVSYSSWNGLKTHADPYLVTDVLKGELGFDGLVVSDWNAIEQVDPDYREAVRKSVNAGIDLFMVPDSWRTFIPTLKDLVNAGEVSASRIDDAVTRILRVKFEAGLFEEPYADRRLLAEQSFGSAEHRAVAREAVRKSLVLLKNENDLLPLSKNTESIFVAGSKADDIGYQCGGWTISWQGSTGDITPGTTILEGIQQAVSDQTTVTYSPNGSGASGHDVAVVVVGERPYAEGRGDKQDLSLSQEDLSLLQNVRSSGVPTVVILLSGRPMIVTDQIDDWDAFIAAWLPGTEGAGVSDVLFGDYEFTGTLPMTWPASMEQIPINVGDTDDEPLFPYGFGLTTGSETELPGSFTLSASAGNGTVELNWTVSNHASEYEVLRAESADGPFTSIANGLTSTSYTDAEAINDTTYYYRVTAKNSVGETNSNTVSATPSLSAPGSFTLSARAGNESVTLNWTASAGADHYTVRRATDADGPYATLAENRTTTAYEDSGLSNGTTYYYRVTAENAAGSTDSNVVSAVPRQPADLQLEYRAGDTNETDNQMKPHLNIINTGSEDVPLSELTVRYWYTDDSGKSERYFCDWAAVGCRYVQAQFVDMATPAADANAYVEIRFDSGAGVVPAGGSSGEIQSRIHYDDWSVFNEANDYSYDGTQTSFAVHDRVTLYHNGTLVYGIEP